MDAKAIGGRIADADQVLGNSEKAMLRAEERDELSSRSRCDQINHVAKPRIDRSRVADESDAPTAQRPPVGFAENFEAGSDDGHGLSDEMVRCAMPARSFGIEQRRCAPFEECGQIWFPCPFQISNRFARDNPFEGRLVNQ